MTNNPFSTSQNPTDVGGGDAVTNHNLANITRVQEQYTDTLMSKKHVVGVAVGLRKRQNAFTNEYCLVVMVDQKLPSDQLNPQDRIPSEIDGIPVDVQEMGLFSML